MSELTPELLRVFVSKIIVYEKETKWSKTAPQKIRVRFRDFDLDEPCDENALAQLTEKADSENSLSA